MMRPILSCTPLLLILSACGGDGGDPADRADLVAVRRGPMKISVTERAEIVAARNTRVINQMEGSSTVIYLIPEGSIVEAGDKLVELDSSNQEERRASQEITVQKSNAAVVAARKDLEILRRQVKADIRAAENGVVFAEMDKDKFFGQMLDDGSMEMGERLQSIKAEEAAIALAESELKLAKDRYEWSVQLRTKDFITQDDLDKDQLDYDSKRTRVELAKNKLAILQKYTHIKTEKELDQLLADARLELDRTIARGEAQIAQAEADLASKEKENKLAKERLENLEKQIRNAIVRAPTPGIVVYGSEGNGWRRRAVEEGAEVRERQTLIVLPDTTHMLAELSVQEVMIDKIRPGLPARIKIDNSPDWMHGAVLRRAPLPDSGARRGNPDLKEYKTVIDIAGNNSDDRLKPNMSATVEIVIAELPDVLSVPQQAVHTQGVVHYAWVYTGGQPEARRIWTGEHNESLVVIEKGLEEDELVYLVTPPDATTPAFEQPPSEVVEVPAAALALQERLREEEGPPEDGEESEAPRRPGGKLPIDGDAGAGSGADDGSESANGPAVGREERGSRGRNGAGVGATAMRNRFNAFKAKVLERLPALAGPIETAGRRWMMDPEIRKQIEADPELAAELAGLSLRPRGRSRERPRTDGSDTEAGAGAGPGAGQGASGDGN